MGPAVCLDCHAGQNKKPGGEGEQKPSKISVAVPLDPFNVSFYWTHGCMNGSLNRSDNLPCTSGFVCYRRWDTNDRLW